MRSSQAKVLLSLLSAVYVIFLSMIFGALIWVYGEYSFSERASIQNFRIAVVFLSLAAGMLSMIPFNLRVWRSKSISWAWLGLILIPFLVLLYGKYGPADYPPPIHEISSSPAQNQ
jgi:hypothetical protein